MAGKTVDYLDVYMAGRGDTLTTTRESRAVDEMFILSLNKRCRVDISYIASGAGVSVEQAVYDLRGAIYQDPAAFGPDESYDIKKYWVVAPVYLSGNVAEKLEVARKVNKRFGGVFDANVKALKNALPTVSDINDIYINLGASWIPEVEYGRFIRTLFKCTHPVKVIYNIELSRYKIILHPDDVVSEFNLSKYGVKGEYKVYGRKFEKQYITGGQIIQDTANAKTVKVFDYKGADYEPVLNKEKTIEAQEKQAVIIEEFRKWVCSDKSRAARFVEYYNRAFAKYSLTHYDGGFLKLPALNPAIKLYKHQRDAIARILLSGSNILLAHSVGAGKTYEMIISVHELYRLGFSKKNLIVVPNNVLGWAASTHKYLYKDDNILVVAPKDFTPAKRDGTLAKMRDGDYTAMYIAYSCFDRIVMSKEYNVSKMESEIKRINAAAFNTADKTEKNMLTVQAERLSKKLTKYISESMDCPWLPFDKLGIETLVIDEAHNYKNIGVQTLSDNVVGLNQAGSKKAREALEKAHFVKRVILATGTPLANSLTDLYTMQTYLQPETLNYHKIASFDSWVNTFGEKETDVECDVDANSKNLRVMTRFTSFHNLGELVALFSQVCDFYQPPEDEEGLPAYDGPVDVCVPCDDGLKVFIYELSDRTEKIRAKEVKRTEDNLLKITTEGRLGAVDLRLLGRYDLYDPLVKGKIDYCADNVYKKYVEYPDGAQVVFCDIGTPKEKFNVYDCLAEKLTSMGVKREDIAYVHDAESERARAKLFADINRGKIRVVIGSTQKIGVGVNIQQKLVALHHLSVPWKPADLEQREGRILRKGNTMEKVYIYRYITEGSFDSYSWQLIENKQKFIASLLSGFCAERDMGDIADTVLSYAEVKALALGNDLIKDRVKTAVALDRAKIASKARQKNMQEMRIYIENSPEEIRSYREKANAALRDFGYFAECKTSVSNDERIAFGEELLAALSENSGRLTERLFDVYRGFNVILPPNMLEDSSYVFLSGETGEKYYCKMELDKTPLGCSKTVDYFLEHLNEYAVKLQRKAADVKRNVKAFKIELEKDNPYIEEVEKLKGMLEEIDKKLEKREKESDDERRRAC